MPRFSQIVLVLAALAAAAALAWQLLGGSREQPTPQVRDEAAGSDYYVTDARLLQTDELGRPEYRITASRMTHFPEQDLWLLQEPTMQLFTEAGEPWHGKAERGRVWAGGDEAELQGQVQLWRQASEVNRPITIDTSQVYLRPPENYAETAAPVAVQQEQNHLTGVGAQVYLDEERYVLLSNVKGHYEPSAD